MTCQQPIRASDQDREKCGRGAARRVHSGLPGQHAEDRFAAICCDHKARNSPVQPSAAQIASPQRAA